MSARRFQLILVKPSHYDDDGYVIQWVMSAMPSNSLAVLYGLARDAEFRGILGPDVAIDITVIDETNTRVKPRKIIRKIAQHGGFIAEDNPPTQIDDGNAVIVTSTEFQSHWDTPRRFERIHGEPHWMQVTETGRAFHQASLGQQVIIEFPYELSGPRP